MKKVWPYLLIALVYGAFLFFKHPQVFSYKFNLNTVHDYLRSQDVEDPQGLIKDRIWVSDDAIYQATGYLYVGGTNPTKYNFQHPPLIKYLFGLSIILTGNPYYVQIFFGLVLLWLTYFLGVKLFENRWIPFVASGFLLIDPAFGGMMNETLLDLGQAVFALGYVILAIFYPANFILQGLTLGLFAASKFWSTTIIFVTLAWAYKLLIKREKINWKKLILSFVIAVLVFATTYADSFIKAGGLFNIFAFEGRVLKFMLSHNSATTFGGPVLLFTTGFFTPWWKPGVLRAIDWSLLWPMGLVVGVIGAIREFRERAKNARFLVYLLPFIYLLLASTQVPFTRYFIIILPFLYVGLVGFFLGLNRHK